MIAWKSAAKHYKNFATNAMLWLRDEQNARLAEADVIVAARIYARLITEPTTPYVTLVTGQDVNIQKAQEMLVEAVTNLEEFIQTYSQNVSQIESEENLDNAPPV
jgi:hypothetical protein